MIEPEIAFADLKDDIALACDYVRYIVKYVLDNNMPDLEFLQQREQYLRKTQKKSLTQAKSKGKKAYEKALASTSAMILSEYFDTPLIERLRAIAEQEYKIITYTDAIEILKSAEKEGKCKKFDEPPTWGEELSTQMERALAEEIFRTVVVVTDYPKVFKGFYMRENDDGKTVAAMDILAPGIGELIGGSQREERLDVLKRMIEEKGLNADDYDWYIALRKYGTQKHA